MIVLIAITNGTVVAVQSCFDGGSFFQWSPGGRWPEVGVGSQWSLIYKLQSVSWNLAEFHHNKIVQSPHENYFNVCRQHKEK